LTNIYDFYKYSTQDEVKHQIENYKKIRKKLLNEIYTIENIKSLKPRYDELWKLVREKIYKLEKFKNADTGLKTGIFSYNNMFIWNTIDDIVSDKNIYSQFENNFLRLRKLYKKYIKEIKKINLIDNIKLLKKIKSSIVRTETLVNILYFYGWNIKTFKELENVSVRKNKRKKHLHEILTPKEETERCIFVNRDKNACKNILYLGKYFLRNQSRPIEFCPKPKEKKAVIKKRKPR